MPPEIQRLADNFLHTPERIEVARPATAAATITQRLKKTSDHPAEKREALRGLIREHEIKNAIIFCNRKKDVGVVFRSLQRHGFNVGALHGDMDQRQRMATLEAFRSGEISLLAASDVAARGLDIPEVSHVFNYDVPVHPEDYVHRIGRTGRAGREGYAAMLVTPKDHKALKAIESMLREEIQWVGDAPNSEEIEEPKNAARQNGRGRRRGTRNRRNGQKSAEAAKTTGQSRTKGKGADSESTVRAKGKSSTKPAPSSIPAPASKGRTDNNRNNQSVGMGDHVPAFMMRPVRAG
jgi:superfamily II DNA/RNA helicase